MPRSKDLPPPGLDALDGGAGGGEAPPREACPEEDRVPLTQYLRRLGVPSDEAAEAVAEACERPERAETREALPVTLKTLKTLQHAHLTHVPFENLSQHAEGAPAPLISAEAGLCASGVPRGLPREAFDKVVLRARGGFCMELNPLFCWALRRLGFRARILRATANVSRTHAEMHAAPAYGVPNHTLVLVTLPKAQYVADVGFGRGPVAPMKLVLGRVQTEGMVTPEMRNFRLRGDGRHLFLEVWADHKAHGLTDWTEPLWYPRVRFDFQPWTDADVAAAADRILRAPDSWFVRTVIAMQLTRTHVHVLQNNELVHTDLATLERDIETLDANGNHRGYERALARYFGVRAKALEGRITVPLPLEDGAPAPASCCAPAPAAAAAAAEEEEQDDEEKTGCCAGGVCSVAEPASDAGSNDAADADKEAAPLVPSWALAATAAAAGLTLLALAAARFARRH